MALTGWIRCYVSACLTIVRAYIEAGKPNSPKPLASYGGWSDLVRGALIWLGYADPVESMEVAREDDPELTNLRAMIGAWYSAFGTEAMTCREAIDAATRCQPSVEGSNPSSPIGATELCHPDLYEALLRIASIRSVIEPKRLGTWFDKSKGKISGNLRFVRLPGTQGGFARWRLEAVRG